MLHEKKPNHIRTCSTMSLLLILSTQTLLMASGNCLECITCLRTADHPTDCTGLTRPCAPAQVCMTLHMRTLYIMNGLNLHFVRRQCIDSIACGQRGSLSSKSHKTKFSIDCCSTDNCRVAIPMLPPDNTTFNGLLCPASSSMLGDVYEPGQAMKCSGDEDQCFHLRRKIPEESGRYSTRIVFMPHFI
ncbi:phospholipase A2 inhibitor and Ly6/PLAUR domain-containing protein-like [Engystomops pustulosus]|uniref:phospholipase A2 inhibitor and Ly6/PLAUR domain-containing protein-like n=1 Tax=Engystomops pustulosus TaxID=76066 RepID=UPI003AFB7450